MKPQTSFVTIERLEIVINVIKDLALKGETLTYGELATLLDCNPRNLNLLLDVVQQFCLYKRIPNLAVLIVNKDTQTVGAGSFSSDSFDIDIARVRSFDWTSYEFPTAKRLSMYQKGAGF